MIPGFLMGKAESGSDDSGSPAQQEHKRRQMDGSERLKSDKLDNSKRKAYVVLEDAE